jgi:hypothetical protein
MRQAGAVLAPGQMIVAVAHGTPGLPKTAEWNTITSVSGDRRVRFAWQIRHLLRALRAGEVMMPSITRVGICWPMPPGLMVVVDPVTGASQSVQASGEACIPVLELDLTCTLSGRWWVQVVGQSRRWLPTGPWVDGAP